MNNYNGDHQNDTVPEKASLPIRQSIPAQWKRLKKLDFRFLIFLAFFILFLTLAPFIAFYALGWTINLKNLDIFESGGLLINIENKHASLAIIPPSAENSPGQKRENKETIKKLEIDKKDFLVRNLRPEFYRLEISKAGFMPWIKYAEVLPKRVAIFDHVVLPPDKAKFFQLFGASDMLTAGENIIWYGLNHWHYGNRELRGQRFVDSDSRTKKIILADNNNFYLNEAKDGTFTDLNRILLFIRGIDTKQNAADAVRAIREVHFAGKNKLLIAGNKTITVDIDRLTYILISQSDEAEKPTTETEAPLVDATIKNGVLMVKNDSGVFEWPIPLTLIFEKIQSFAWYKDKNHFLALLDNTLYFVEITKQPPINYYKLADKVKKFFYNDNENKVYILTGQTIEIFDFE